MTGKEIKKLIISNGIKVWQVAEAFGCADNTFSRKLRHSFNEAETKKLLSIIEQLKEKAPDQ